MKKEDLTVSGLRLVPSCALLVPTLEVPWMNCSVIFLGTSMGRSLSAQWKQQRHFPRRMLLCSNALLHIHSYWNVQRSIKTQQKNNELRGRAAGLDGFRFNRRVFPNCPDVLLLVFSQRVSRKLYVLVLYIQTLKLGGERKEITYLIFFPLVFKTKWPYS